MPQRFQTITRRQQPLALKQTQAVGADVWTQKNQDGSCLILSREFQKLKDVVESIVLKTGVDTKIQSRADVDGRLTYYAKVPCSVTTGISTVGVSGPSSSVSSPSSVYGDARFVPGSPEGFIVASDRSMVAAALATMFGKKLPKEEVVPTVKAALSEGRFQKDGNGNSVFVQPGISADCASFLPTASVNTVGVGQPIRINTATVATSRPVIRQTQAQPAPRPAIRQTQVQPTPRPGIRTTQVQPQIQQTFGRQPSFQNVPTFQNPVDVIQSQPPAPSPAPEPEYHPGTKYVYVDGVQVRLTDDGYCEVSYDSLDDLIQQRDKIVADVGGKDYLVGAFPEMGPGTRLLQPSVCDGIKKKYLPPSMTGATGPVYVTPPREPVTVDGVIVRFDSGYGCYFFFADEKDRQNSLAKIAQTLGVADWGNVPVPSSSGASGLSGVQHLPSEWCDRITTPGPKPNIGYKVVPAEEKTEYSYTVVPGVGASGDHVGVGVVVGNTNVNLINPTTCTVDFTDGHDLNGKLDNIAQRLGTTVESVTPKLQNSSYRLPPSWCQQISGIARKQTQPTTSYTDRRPLLPSGPAYTDRVGIGSQMNHSNRNVGVGKPQILPSQLRQPVRAPQSVNRCVGFTQEWNRLTGLWNAATNQSVKATYAKQLNDLWKANPGCPIPDFLVSGLAIDVNLAPHSGTFAGVGAPADWLRQPVSTGVTRVVGKCQAVGLEIERLSQLAQSAKNSTVKATYEQKIQNVLAQNPDCHAPKYFSGGDILDPRQILRDAGLSGVGVGDDAVLEYGTPVARAVQNLLNATRNSSCADLSALIVSLEQSGSTATAQAVRKIYAQRCSPLRTSVNNVPSGPVRSSLMAKAPPGLGNPMNQKYNGVGVGQPRVGGNNIRSQVSAQNLPRVDQYGNVISVPKTPCEMGDSRYQVDSYGKCVPNPKRVMGQVAATSVPISATLTPPMGVGPACPPQVTVHAFTFMDGRAITYVLGSSKSNVEHNVACVGQSIGARNRVRRSNETGPGSIRPPADASEWNTIGGDPYHQWLDIGWTGGGWHAILPNEWLPLLAKAGVKGIAGLSGVGVGDSEGNLMNQSANGVGVGHGQHGGRGHRRRRPVYVLRQGDRIRPLLRRWGIPLVRARELYLANPHKEVIVLSDGGYTFKNIAVNEPIWIPDGWAQSNWNNDWQWHEHGDYSHRHEGGNQPHQHSSEYVQTSVGMGAPVPACPSGFFFDQSVGECRPLPSMGADPSSIPPVWCPPGQIYRNGQCVTDLRTPKLCSAAGKKAIGEAIYWRNQKIGADRERNATKSAEFERRFNAAMNRANAEGCYKQAWASLPFDPWGANQIPQPGSIRPGMLSGIGVGQDESEYVQTSVGMGAPALCPSGMVLDPVLGECLPQCPPGQIYRNGQCVADLRTPNLCSKAGRRAVSEAIYWLEQFDKALQAGDTVKREEFRRRSQAAANRAIAAGCGKQLADAQMARLPDGDPRNFFKKFGTHYGLGGENVGTGAPIGGVKCPAGQYFDPSANHCVPWPGTPPMMSLCPAGQTIRNGVCVPDRGTPAKLCSAAGRKAISEAVYWREQISGWMKENPSASGYMQENSPKLAELKRRMAIAMQRATAEGCEQQLWAALDKNMAAQYISRFLLSGVGVGEWPCSEGQHVEFDADTISLTNPSGIKCVPDAPTGGGPDNEAGPPAPHTPGALPIPSGDGSCPEGFVQDPLNPMNFCIPGGGIPTCGFGQFYDPVTQNCVTPSDPLTFTCPPGQHQDATSGVCVCDNQQMIFDDLGNCVCPFGTFADSSGNCVKCPNMSAAGECVPACDQPDLEVYDPSDNSCSCKAGFARDPATQRCVARTGATGGDKKPPQPLTTDPCPPGQVPTRGTFNGRPVASAGSACGPAASPPASGIGTGTLIALALAGAAVVGLIAGGGGTDTAAEGELGEGEEGFAENPHDWEDVGRRHGRGR